ncbi:MAG: MFS transporter [Ignavibacteriales bacterium]|nr:MAG: MFS transporter [Ignavibacteriales bacterium]
MLSMKSGQINLKSLPSLSESSFFRYFTFSALYIAQGIPEGLLWYAIPAWLAMNGKSPTEIGSYVAVIGIPWSLKIINAPIMDRFTFLAMGRRRPWVLFGQVGLILSFFSMSLIAHPLDNLYLLMILGFIVSFFEVTQDIAVDGMAIDILPVNQQARANGLMWGSKTLGISGAVATGSWIMSEHGYFYAIISFSIIVSLIIIIPLLLRERPGEKLLPWTNGEASKVAAKIQLHSWKSIFKSLIKVFFLPVSFMMGVAAFSFSTGRGLIDTVLPVFTVQHLGWADTHYSQIFATANLISGILGMIIGGFLIDYFGKVKMISIYLVILILLVGSMSFLRVYWQSEVFITAFIICFYTLVTFTTIAIFASAMQLCWKRISVTQFTLYMAISNLGLAAGAAIMGQLKGFLDWEFVILAYIFFAATMLILMRFINFEQHQKRVDELELRYNESTEGSITVSDHIKNTAEAESK